MIDESQLRADDAERALIGALAADPYAIARVVHDLPGGDFYHFNRGRVWDAARVLLGDDQLVTPPTLLRRLGATDELDSGTRHVVQQEMVREFSMSEVGRVRQHADLVADMARRREWSQALKRAARAVMEHPGDSTVFGPLVQAEFDELTSQEASREVRTLSWSQLLDEFEEWHDPDVEQRGIETPWPELNELIGDLHGGRMYVIGGSPGDGKSTAALNIAAHAAAGKEAVLVFSKEMPTVDVTGRLVARGAEIDLRAINSRRLNSIDRAKVGRFRKQTGDYQLWVNADPIPISAVKRITRNFHTRHNVSLVVVDYLQLMTGDERGRSAEEEIARISTELKSLAMELGIAIVVPAQLNRNPSARMDQKPTKADLRQSGRIEQDADVVVLLWRQPIQDGPDHGKPDPHYLTFVVDKNRHGPTGLVQLRWNGGYGLIGSTGRPA